MGPLKIGEYHHLLPNPTKTHRGVRKRIPPKVESTAVEAHCITKAD